MFQQLNQLPLGIFTSLFALLLIVSIAVGAWLRRYVPIDPASVGGGQFIFGTFSILSLLIGFTFSLALNRHDERRDLLLEEANAIRAMDRMLAHVEEPGRSQISVTLNVYANGRLEFMKSNLLVQEDMQAERAGEREQLNMVVANVVPVSKAGITQAQILASSNRILDAGTRMEAIMLAHVPVRVILVLTLLSIGSAVIIGISIGDKLRFLWLPSALWALLLSTSLFTIVDLDASHWGSIRLNPAPMEAAVQTTGGHLASPSGALAPAPYQKHDPQR